jgi:copper transport protein
MRRLVVLGALLALAAPGQAFAHASLRSTFPTFRERIETSPGTVRLRFDQIVKALPDSILVLDAQGDRLSGATTSNRFTVTVPVRPLPRGAYTVRWHVISGDGHVVSGVYTFGVRMKAPPPTEAAGASGPTTSEDVVRWAYFLALALLVGGLGFRLVVLRGPIPRRLERRFYWVTGLGAVGVLEVGILAFMLRAEDALQLPFSRFLYGDLSPVAGGTSFGEAFIGMSLGFAVVAGLLYLGWLTDRAAFLWAALAGGLVLASGLSLSGHSAADPGDSRWSELADWVHLSAAMLWTGGLVMLAFAVWPSAPELRRRAFLGFARLAPFLMGLLLAAGIYLSILRLPHLRDLWTTGYGEVLLVKLSLVAVALAWGAVHHFVVTPRLERDGPTGGVGRSLLGESALATAVLLVAAVLVDSKPPPQVGPVTGAQRAPSAVLPR